MNSTDTAIVARSQWEEPIRAELFGIERLEQHAASLAAAQRTTDEPSRGRDLLPRVHENAHRLLAAYRNIAETVRERSEITPAAEWILDNFHVVVRPRPRLSNAPCRTVTRATQPIAQ